MGTPGLECTTCGVVVRIERPAGGDPTVMWALDADGGVLEQGTVGEGHTILGRSRPGHRPTLHYCAGPILPRGVRTTFTDPSVIELTGTHDIDIDINIDTDIVARGALVPA